MCTTLIIRTPVAYIEGIKSTMAQIQIMGVEVVPESIDCNASGMKSIAASLHET
jgi:hypothetical protein